MTRDPATSHLLASLRCGVALILAESDLDRLNAFWLAMESRARASLAFGERLTLDTFAASILAEAEAVAVDPSSVAGQLQAQAVEGRGYVDSTDSLLLGIRSPLAPG